MLRASHFLCRSPTMSESMDVTWNMSILAPSPYFYLTFGIHLLLSLNFLS